MWDYGRHLGLAFQYIDDILDFTQTEEQLGKPQVGAVERMCMLSSVSASCCTTGAGRSAGGCYYACSMLVSRLQSLAEAVCMGRPQMDAVKVPSAEMRKSKLGCSQPDQPAC